MVLQVCNTNYENECKFASKTSWCSKQGAQFFFCPMWDNSVLRRTVGKKFCGADVTYIFFFSLLNVTRTWHSLKEALFTVVDVDFDFQIANNMLCMFASCKVLKLLTVAVRHVNSTYICLHALFCLKQCHWHSIEVMNSAVAHVIACYVENFSPIDVCSPLLNLQNESSFKGTNSVLQDWTYTFFHKL